MWVDTNLVHKHYHFCLSMSITKHCSFYVGLCQACIGSDDNEKAVDTTTQKKNKKKNKQNFDVLAKTSGS